MALTRAATTADIPSLKLVIASCGLFPPDMLEEMMHGYLSQTTNDTEFWIVVTEYDKCVGVAYCAQEKLTNGTWNLLALGVHEFQQRQGYGSCLVEAVEKELKARQGRLLLVETSSAHGFTNAQQFYKKIGFVEEGRVRNYYDVNDDKVIFAKALSIDS